MFRFIRHYAEQIEGAQVYPLISLFIFLVFFIALLFYVKNMDKTVARTISSIPLDSEEPTSKNELP